MSSDTCLSYLSPYPEKEVTVIKYDCGFSYVVDHLELTEMYDQDNVTQWVKHLHKEEHEMAKKKFSQDNYYKNTQEEYGTAPKFPPGKPTPIFYGNFYVGPGTGLADDCKDEETTKATEDYISSWAKMKNVKLGYSNWHEPDHGNDHVTYVHHTSGGSTKYISSSEVYYTPAYDRGRPPIDQMPGLRARVKHPVQGHDWYTLEQVIISLNDQYRWTRERIADWLDTLDIDLSFKTEESV